MYAKHSRLILVIDAQKCFCDAGGSLAHAFGERELARISSRLWLLDEALASYPHPREVYLIRSEYTPGQFTDGDLHHPFAHACVRGHGGDCDWSLSGPAIADKRVITKHKESAWSVPGFEQEIGAMAQDGLREILIMGFLTTSCVSKTALDLRASLSASITVAVIEGLCGSRASNYQPAAGAGVSRHEQVIEMMKLAGVQVIEGSHIPPHPVPFDLNGF